MRDAPWIIYGANGVSGRLVLAEALQRGHRPILGGRDPSIHALGEAHKLETVCVGLDDKAGLAALLKKGSRVLHIAGPYAVTAAPMLDACIATQTPYLDLCGEIGSIGATFARDAEAKAAGIPLVAGAGFGVSAAESLAIHVARRARGAHRLLLGVKLDNAYKSVGAALSTLHVLGRGGAWVSDGQLRSGGMAHMRFHATVDGGRHTFIAAPLADVLAAHRSTGIREVIAGIPVPSVMAPILRLAAPLLQRLLRRPGLRRFLERRVRKQEPPAAAPTRTSHRSFVWAQAAGEQATSTAVLSIGEGYAFATASVVRSAELLSSFDGAGAWTPASAFGPDFVLGLDGVQRRDLAA